MKLKRRNKEEVWSPYGHEAARRRLLAERRIQIIVGAIALVFVYWMILTLTAEDSGPQVSSSIGIPEHRQKPVTVGVTPGGVPAFARPGIEPPEASDTPSPVYERNEWLAMIQPYLTLVAPLFTAFWLLSKAGGAARGKLAELNFGVYKGAMPYEMHAARSRARVFTHRQVGEHVFGKKREDYVFGTYLNEPPLAVRQMLGMSQNDRAEVTRLKRGGARRPT